MDSIFSKLQSVTENYYSGLSDRSIVPKKTVEEIKNYLKDRDLMSGENIESTLEDLAAFHKRIIDQGNTWFSILKLKENLYLRACVTSIHTEKQHVEQLFVNLDNALYQLPN